jgi:type I restriction enzyme, S subunit
MNIDDTNGNSLPASWSVEPLSACNQRRLAKINPASHAAETFEYYSIPAFQRDQRPTLAKGSEIGSSKLLLDSGTVLFGKLNPRVEKVWRVGNYSSYRKIGSTEWLPLFPRDDVDEQFLYFLLWSEHVMPKAKTLASGSTPSRQRVDPRSFYSIEVPLPPVAEQRNIATVLGLVRRAMEQQERLIALTTELKKALLHKLFSQGLRGESQKQTELGALPQSWEVVTLGLLAKVGNGSTPKRDNENYWRGGIIPWLNSTKIHERFITGADQFVTELAVKECHLPRVKPGSLLIAITGQGKTLGNSALVSFETCINQHLAYAQFTSSRVLPEFVLWFMQTRYEHLRSIAQAGGSTKGALTCGLLKTYPVPVPSPDEQSDIAQVFAALDRKVKAHEDKHNTLASLFRTLLNQLMTAELRVKDLDLRNLSKLNQDSLEGVGACG